MKLSIHTCVYTLIGTAVATLPLFAQGPGRPASEVPPTEDISGITTLKSPIEAKSIDALIANIIDLVLFIAIPILICVFIWIGLKFVLAQGKPEEIKNAKSMLLWTLVGAAIVIGAKTIQVLVSGTIGAIIK
jgi:heme/copper-type cytochrome/quinol oxidase subunit 2